MEAETYHIPALLNDCISALNIHPDGYYADLTFGGGGHSRAILEHLDANGHLFGFDRDMDAARNIPDAENFTFVHGNFRHLANFMRFYDAPRLDGILADLGVSFHHFDDMSRGFSFREDAPLDMRMNRNGGRTAADILNESSKEELEGMFRTYTDLKRPGRLADMIVKKRTATPILTTFQLADAVRPALNPKSEKKDLAQVFQGIRIEVNDEMGALREFLTATPKVLKPGGRLAIITYHSIEDRIVKNFMKTGNTLGIEEKDFFGNTSSPWKLITRSPIVPSDEEVERNPRSRSAKLRVAELKD